MSKDTLKKLARRAGQGRATQPSARGSLANPKNAALAQLPIFKDEAKHDFLVKYITDRLQMVSPEREARVKRCENIDLQLSGFIHLDKDDRLRMREILTKGRVKPVDHNLPMADAQLDDAAAYILSVFAPDMNLFESAAPADKAEQAKALTQEINNQGQKAQHYRHISKLCVNALKYNFGAMSCHWEKKFGITFEGGASQAGTITPTPGVVWEGNMLKCLDTYNFFYDVSVHPVDLPNEGEWYATVEITTPFRAMRAERNGYEYGVDRFYNKATSTISRIVDRSFYRSPPNIRRNTESGDGNTTQTDWTSVFTAGAKTASASTPGLEKIIFVGWVIPAMLGLGDSKDEEIWKLHLYQGKYITYAVKLKDSHGMLPCAIAAPIEDDLGNAQRTYSERLLPLQHFESFLMNSHQQGVRKSLYGITVYNQQLFPGLDLTKEDLTSAIIPMRGSALTTDIDKAFRHYNDAPSTAENVDMIEKVDQIMQKILPTDVYRQVADLERATLYQAAATVQTGNRRSLKITRLISNQCLDIIKTMIVYNIYGNQQAIEYTDKNGQTSEVTPADFLELGLENYISNGLKGIDRLMIITAFKEVLAMILQSQQAIQEIDIVALLGYFFNLVGEPVDLNSFRKTPQQRVVDSTLNNGAPPSTQAGQPATPATAAGGAAIPASIPGAQ